MQFQKQSNLHTSKRCVLYVVLFHPFPVRIFILAWLHYKYQEQNNYAPGIMNLNSGKECPTAWNGV